jgi:hypothetical protein
MVFSRKSADLESAPGYLGLLRFGEENGWPFRWGGLAFGFLLALAVYGVFIVGLWLSWRIIA